MYELLHNNGAIDVRENELSIARIYIFNKNVFVKILQDGYEFACDSVDTALKLIKIRVER